MHAKEQRAERSWWFPQVEPRLRESLEDGHGKFSRQKKVFFVLTDYVSWTSINAKELSIPLESLAEIEEKGGASLDANHGVGFAHLHSFSCLF